MPSPFVTTLLAAAFISHELGQPDAVSWSVLAAAFVLGLLEFVLAGADDGS